MNRNDLRRQVRYYSQFFPFTVNTLLCALAIWGAHRLLYAQTPEGREGINLSNLRPFLVLMARMTFWFLIALIALSLLSTIATWAWYLWLKGRRNAELQLSFTTEGQQGKSSRLFMNAAIEGARRPLLGFVKGRLFYDNYQLTDKFPLLSNRHREQHFWRDAITGRSRLALPDIKEYQLRGGFVFFEDMLHLFSLAVPQPLSGQFYQPPVLRRAEDEEVAPRKTETLDVRIDQMRRVEGEPLSYKDFEAGDDVRRIVWKVYAKNRDLVVRMPERFEPYASHLYFYASFYASVRSQWAGSGFGKELLNYYKNNVWTVYDTLSRKEWQLRYIPDQRFNLPEHLPEAERNARIISNSAWQGDRPLSDYFDTRQGTVLCISSLTDPADLSRILDAGGDQIVIYFVKLSRTFRHFVAWGWLQRLLFLPPKDRLSKLRSRWIFSPLRWQVRSREKEIERLLQASGVTYTIL